jgi:type II secretory ATPase GspE/PulE/Tfp pilus assembly ATPase PilB-like protein
MLDGVNQVQIHPEAGLTFATCLPAIFRQDPDIIMVGEIRDAETAEIALRASQTGHLVLSTLHTNDSVSAITRLMDLGIPRYLIGALNGVISQRLVRNLCSCRKVLPASRAYQESLAALGLQDKPAEMYQPVGCGLCENTGYKGRVGVFEILPIDKPVRDAVQADAHPEDLRILVRNSGLLTMQDDAIEKIRLGKTTLEEVRRVLPTYTSSSARCSDCGREFVASFQHCPFCGFPLIGSDSERSEILSS